ncbi:nucleotidyltransferase and HEPN domain-containing protein [Rhizobium sp. NXC24]|uniref:nucleotidyltransferase and HEPN domain-containing protein n=1 Tax=Rhizobium sp. NXC24 TaxID=2048897 RepID=UPI000CDF37F9|nr:nucleotidyltransferase and HEPN domain-containing protein [Rhizobium sp. NXC24]AVA25754.1 nucleotidyltransferase HEPN domain-containing protein [Rhizobium sp. NXC24]
MNSSIEHLPPVKQRELSLVVEVLPEEFEDMLEGGWSDFKKRGRILNIILFGSYARGDWVDEPHKGKGYRSDFDLMIVVNNRKLTNFARYWQNADDRLMHLREVETPVRFIVHSRREVNTALKRGRYFFEDIRRDGIVLYELDDEPLVEPRPHSKAEAHKIAKEHFESRYQGALEFENLSKVAFRNGWLNRSAFLLHQSIEQAYATLLLVLTNYSPASHNLKHLRGLAKSQAPQLAEVWPRDQQRYVAWFNIVNEAYVKARYSKHYEISQEAIAWLSARVASLIAHVETICRAKLEALTNQADEVAR